LKRLICIGSLALARLVSAQGAPPSLEFSFSNPGARSLGFGGAFVALADDATASFANPAGLIQLTRPEVSAEGRLWRFSNPFTVGGRLSGAPTGIGLDQTSGLRTDNASAALSGLSFLSFVYPGDNWSIALYRHQTANFESRSETQGFFADEPGLPLPPRFIDVRTETDLEVVSYGFAGAFRLADNFSLGGGVSLMRGRWNNDAELNASVPETFPEGRFGINLYAPEAQFATSRTRMDSSDWTFNGGFLWTPETRWSFGGFFRLGPTFALSGEDQAGPAFDRIPSDLVLPRGAEGSIGLPNVFGLGAAFKSESGALTVSFEWDYVEYSRIVETLDLEPVADDDDVELRDANELHIGLEYAFITRSPLVALRLGAWLDPDHRFRCIEDSDPFCQAIFRGGDDELHFAIGLGVAFARFQLDVGLDLSEPVDTLSVSAIFSF